MSKPYKGDKDIKLSDLIKTVYSKELQSLTRIIIFIQGEKIKDI